MERVVVTAGAAGLGRAMAEAFLAQGATVAICDIDEKAVADFSQANPQALARVANVAQEDSVADFFDHVEKTWGESPSLLCANAGTGGPALPVEEMSFQDWRDCLAVNLDGAFLAIRQVVPGMKRRGSGLIILTASSAGLMGYPFRTPYAAAKWGVVGLMKSLAMELGPQGIRVNALCPGALTGDRMERVLANEAKARAKSVEEVRQSYVETVSLRTWIDPEEVAAMAVYLASQAGRNISGQALSIDGHTETLGG